ncbi:spore germination protein GerPE [Neobacillus sp. PS3-34]|uniref:spore germination protein GerPE n=1 Tax=Neobacillus sp. PS3-34 TaxID=3070678 RepID=UPI0027E1FB55|nr:spore germination protein GerPE [Neobacillus sp. PS3-34]WML49624.1 spore germination protein GerPE [Neobacillus sp. PS3-34]
MFFGNEGSFDYPVFTEPIPLPPITEPFRMYRQNINPVIRVSSIDLIGATAASVIHIGSTCHVQLEARIKHIRQLGEEGKQAEKKEE